MRDIESSEGDTQFNEFKNPASVRCLIFCTDAVYWISIYSAGYVLFVLVIYIVLSCEGC